MDLLENWHGSIASPSDYHSIFFGKPERVESPTLIVHPFECEAMMGRAMAAAVTWGEQHRCRTACKGKM